MSRKARRVTEEETNQLAMLYVIEHVASNEAVTMLGIIGVFANPGIGISVTLDWPKFLGCSEQDILDALTEYACREMDRFIWEVGSCETAISQEVAATAREFRDSEAGRRFAEDRARRVWKFYSERSAV
jgi:hypothetical protein